MNGRNAANEVMYKVLISDDERRVRKLIMMLIDCDKIGLEIVGEASSGSEALHLFSKHKPNIVITDIKMPDMNGLELIANIKRMDTDTQFIIISGYSDFSYAVTAIKNNVLNYLLKPINENELNNALRNAVDKIEERMHTTTTDQFNGPLSRALISNMLSKNSKPLSFKELHEKYSCTLKGKNFQVACLQLFCKSKDSILVKTEALDYINKYCRNFAIDKELSCLTAICDDSLFFVFSFSTDDFYKVYSEIFNSIKIFPIIKNYYNITFALSSIKINVQGINDAVVEAKNCVENRFTYGINKIIKHTEYRAQNCILEILSSKRLRELAKIIEVYDIDNLKAWIDELHIDCKKQKSIAPKEILEITRNVTDVFCRIWGNIDKSFQADRLKEEITSRQTQMYTTTQVFSDLFFMLKKTMNNFLKSRQYISSKPAYIARKYIMENFKQHLTLQLVADHVAMNSAYLSVLFKKQFNETFVECLTNMRIEEGKRLLTHTNKTVEQVALESGYLDQKYFSRVFLKITGISPSKYRKLYF